MRIHAKTLLSLVCLLLLALWTQGQTAASTALVVTGGQRANIVEGYGKLPLAFEANQGQTDSRVKFLLRTGGYTVFLTENEAVLEVKPAVVHRRSAHSLQLSDVSHQPTDIRRQMPAAKELTKSGVVRMRLEGANASAKVSASEQLPGTSNYFIGKDPAKWRTNVPTYAKVKYEEIYPGIDLIYYGNQRELEYDFVLQPGANPASIRLGIEGADRLRLEHGDLVMTSAAGNVQLRSPHIYQEAHGVRHEVPGGYAVIGKNEVGFLIASYDRNKALVIDPTLAYSTYLGGSGDDGARAVAVDTAGNAYVTGATSSPDFPTVGALQATFHGNSDVFVTKLNADGSAVLYSTYLGGRASDDATSIAVDASGIYLTGDTESSDFPTRNPIQPTIHGHDAFVTKINAAGNDLVYSTFLGGGGWETGWGIAVDHLGNAHVRGDTNSYDFPVRNAIQPHLRARVFNCYVAELNADGSALLYSTYWGGSQGEGGVGIGVDAAGNTYVGGYTFSPDFPTVNPIQAHLAGEQDTFLTKFSADGQTVIYSTYLGGTGDERSEGFTIDSLGNAYTVGYTTSTDFPIANAIQPTNHGGVDAFVAKINAAGNALIYSTYLGGSSDDQATGVAVDAAGNAYVSGYEASTNFPVVNPVQDANHGGRDAFVAKIASDGSQLLYSTYLGGSAHEGSWRDVNVAVDSAGNAYVAGITWSVDFPVTPQVFQQSLKGGAEVFVVKIAPGTPIGVVSPKTLSFGGQLIDTTSAAKRVSLSNTGDAQMTVTSVTATDNFAVQTNKCTNGVKPGSHCDVYVVFSPTQLGALSGTLTFVDNAKNSPQTAGLSGIGQSTTSTTLTSVPNPSTLGQSVKLAAVVIPVYQGQPSGTVTFYDGSTVLGSVALNLGTAQLITSTLVAGSHSLSASYGGDAIFQPSTSSVVNQVVKQKLPTVTDKSAPNPSYVKQDVVFTATVSGISGFVPTGLITFKQGTLVLATVPLANGQASFTMAFTKAGSFSIVASYSGDQNYLPKNSPAVKQIVKKYTTTTALTSSPNPSRYGQLVTFTATVTMAGPYPPTGKVKFWDGTTGIGTAALSNGVAKLTKSTLTVGTHPITAQYLSDAYNDKSTSPVVNQVVQ